MKIVFTAFFIDFLLNYGASNLASFPHSDNTVLDNKFSYISSIVTELFDFKLL